ncbi:EAL domain-containing protein [Rubrivirga sp.]|uniref:EAL domain-containing protein n=1 Tax=Rubrivirga sp. TaxID=1885344 RepID=UPI003B51A46A
MPHVPSSVRRRLTRRAALALGVIALLVASAAALALVTLQQRVADGQEVNVAGRQRMLSQRTAKTALLLRHGAGDAAALDAELDADLEAWARGHRALLDGDARLGVPRVADPLVRERLRALSPLVREATAAVVALRRAVDAGDAARADAALARVLAAEREFLPRMDRAVFALSAGTARDVRRLQRGVAGLLLGMWGVLGLVGWGVFRPVIRSVARSMDEASAQGRLLRTVIDTIPDHIYVKDTQGRATLRNLASARALGFRDPSEATGRTDAEVAAGTEAAPLAAAALADDLAVVRTGVPVENREERALDGGWLLTTKAPLLGPEGEVAGVVGVSRDVTAARTAEARFRALVEHSVVGTAVMQDGRFAYVNPRMAEIFGYAQDEMTGMEVTTILHEDDRAMARENLRRRLDGEVDALTYEARGRRRDGRVIRLDLSGVRAEHEGRPAVIGTVSDVTERYEAERVLYHRAHHDDLTGLPNRALFASRLEVAVAQATSDGAFAVLFIDLDRFKVVNDSLGHSAGDRLLQEVAARLQAVLRPDDTVARLGGDEFAVLLSATPHPGHAEEVAARIQTALTAPVRIDGRDLTVGASIGVVTGRADHASPDAVLREADLAMYGVKAAGRGGQATFSASSHDETSQRMRLEMDLQHVAERDELRVVYQPIVDLADGRLAGFEALVRWAHPELGLLAPDAFIGAAEESGQVAEIDRWVLAEVTRQTAAWPADPGLLLTVNCTGPGLLQQAYLAAVDDALLAHRSAPRRLGLEITETLLVDDPEAVAAELHRLRALGVRFCVDDFGTGYSSLSTLHALPIDTVKVDRAFVAEMDADVRSAQLVLAVVRMGQALDAAVVAEGIETVAQLAALRAMGATYGQGHLFARPLAPEAAAALVGADDRPWAVHWATSDASLSRAR